MKTRPAEVRKHVDEFQDVIWLCIDFKECQGLLGWAPDLHLNFSNAYIYFQFKIQVLGLGQSALQKAYLSP